MPISFGPWEPDRASFQSDALVDALNVVPAPGGYAPSLGFTPNMAVTLSTPIKGATVLSDTSEAVYIYAGSGDQIFVSENGATPVSVYTSVTPITPPLRWQFARFVGKAIAVNPADPPVAGDLGSTMTALGGSPPPAKVMGVVGNFLVLGDLDDGIDGPRPNRVRWSGFRDPTAWGTSIATQADFNDMPDEGGAVQGIVGREFGTVFQRYAISRMTYVGPSTVFQFDMVEKKRGAISPGSIVDAGLVAAYIADDGFFLWDGTSSTPIGAQRVNEYFRSRMYPSSEGLIVGAFDPLGATVSWAYATDGSGVLSERLIYSLVENRWSRSDLRASWFMSGFDVAQTIDQLDYLGPIDGLSISVDDPRFLGGRARSVGFDEEGVYGPLTGDTLAATFETGDWQAAPGSRAYVNNVRPLIDADVATCAVGSRAQALSEPVAWTTDAALARDGSCPLRAAGRYLRFRQSAPAGQAWQRATGVEVSITAEGRR